MSRLSCRGLGSTVSRGKTRSVPGQTGVYHVMYDFTDEPVALAAGRLALELVNSLLPQSLRGLDGLDAIAEGPAFTTWGEAFARFEETASDCALGPTTMSLAQEALRRGIPIQLLDSDSLLRLGQGHLQKRIRASCSDLTSLIATETAADKDFTKALLQEAGLPVPRGKLIKSLEEAAAAARELGFPLVSKPLDGNHGRGVTIGLTTGEEVSWGIAKAQEHGSTVILEQQFMGADHRILVVGGEVVAVAERVPAHVIGDGEHSIKDLVDEVNSDPRRGEGHKSMLTRIDLDEVAVHCLAQSCLTVDSVPDLGQMVILRPTANLSTGGIAIDRTDEIHPENALMARRSAQIVGLDIAGIDFVCPDITKSAHQTGGGIIEVNAGPGFRMHLEPFQGRPRNVARPVLELLFPKGSRGRIPIFAITGTNGKTTTGRMLAQILQDASLAVGLTSTTGIYLNGEQIGAGCAVLQADGTALDAVEAAIRVLEDDPTFNCGTGSAVNDAGECEMCSAIMDGTTFDVGGVSIIQGVRHPISVAHAMLREETILISGPAARDYAARKAQELCPSDALKTDKRARAAKDAQHDTVGCLALDTHGHLAAGTSTGGLDGKPAGRVGDSPQPGSGFYADDQIGAVAYSGDGEHIARMMLAARTMHQLDPLGPDDAVADALRHVAHIGGEAGGIALYPDGTMGWDHNSPQFAVAWASSAAPNRVVRLGKRESR